MLRSIVVPLDGTPRGERALPYAEEVAGATGAALHLVRVRTVDAPPAALTAYPHEGAGLPSDPAGTGAGAEAGYLERIVRRVASHLDTDVDAALLDGAVSPCLSRYAHEVDADALVLATRAPGPLGRALVGSVADEVIRTADVPVLAVTPPVEPTEATPASLSPIVVALDGSQESEAVLPVATCLATALDARVTLLHVLPTANPTVGVPFHLPGDWDDAMTAGEDYLERIYHRLRRRGLRVERVVMAHPSPARAICEVADEIDAGLIALGTHGRSGLGAVVLGSVARAVVAGGHRPVLVRRRV